MRYIIFLSFNAYVNYLKEIHNIEIEDIIEWYFNKYLVEEYDIFNFSVSLSTDKKYINRCKVLFPEFDGILKKYRLFTEYKTINNNQRVTNLTLDEQLDFILSIDSDNFYEDNLVSKIVKTIYIKEETINNKKEQTITIEYFNLGALTKYYE